MNIFETVMSQKDQINALTSALFEGGLFSAATHWFIVTAIGVILYFLFKCMLKAKNVDNHTSILVILKSFIVVVVIYNCLTQIKPAQGMLSALLASGGIIALAISLAAQESVGNLVSGVLLLTFKPFKTGDLIKINNGEYIGFIEEITLRHTILRTYENNRITIPNNKVNNSCIENSNLIDAKKANFLHVQISYDSDLDKAMNIMKELCEAHPSCLDNRTEQEKKDGSPKVAVKITEFAESGIMLRAVVYSENSGAGFNMLSDLRHDIKIAFDNAGIEIPYPTRSLVFKQVAEKIVKDNDMLTVDQGDVVLEEK